MAFLKIWKVVSIPKQLKFKLSESFKLKQNKAEKVLCIDYDTKKIFWGIILRDVAKMLHPIKQPKYFLLISGRFFGHFNQKNQC